MKYKLKKSEKLKEFREVKVRNYFKTFLFVDAIALFLIILGSILIYNTHTNLEAPIFDTKSLSTSNESLGDYPYPLHFDDFNHISQAKQIMEEGLGAKTNPQLYSGDRHKSMEQGFHIILAGIGFITGVSLIKLSLVLPAIFFGLGALLLYLFFSRSLKKPIVGIFSVLFLIFVPSNSNILGFWFLTPSSLTLIFIGGILLLLHELKSPKNIIFAVLLTFISFFIYPIITILLLLIMFAFIVIEYKIWNYFKSKKVWFVIFGAILFLLILFLLKEKLLFDPGWTDVLSKQTILTYIVLIILLFAIAGIFWMFVENKFLFLLVSIYSFFGCISTISYLFFEYGLILPYQRMLFQWGILLSITAGYGVYFMILYFSKFLMKKVLIRKEVFLQRVIITVLVILFLVLLLPSYYVTKPAEFAIQRIVSPEQVKLLAHIDTSQPKAILADPYFSAAIYPISKHKAVAALNGNLDGGEAPYLYYGFLNNLCTEKWKKIQEMRIDFIITNKQQNCEFMREIAVEGNYYLYMFRPELLPYGNVH